MQNREKDAFGLMQRSSLVWLLLLVLAFGNGALREIFMKRFWDEATSQALSVITGCCLMTVGVGVVWKWLQVKTTQNALGVGLYWGLLTFLFESFILNRWMGGLSWDQIWDTYNLAAGHLWPVVLVWVSLLPLLYLRFPRASSRDGLH